MSELTKPIVHLNGLGARNLYEGYSNTVGALLDALVKVQETHPHMRDYYPHLHGEDLYNQARKEHEERLKKINEVVQELQLLQLHVVNFIK